jgi:hypothetical protein
MPELWPCPPASKTWHVGSEGEEWGKSALKSFQVWSTCLASIPYTSLSWFMRQTWPGNSPLLFRETNGEGTKPDCWAWTKESLSIASPPRPQITGMLSWEAIHSTSLQDHPVQDARIQQGPIRHQVNTSHPRTLPVTAPSQLSIDHFRLLHMGSKASPWHHLAANSSFSSKEVFVPCVDSLFQWLSDFPKLWASRQHSTCPPGSPGTPFPTTMHVYIPWSKPSSHSELSVPTIGLKPKASIF